MTFDFLDTPVTVDEIKILNLPDAALQRLAALLEKAKREPLTVQESAQLQAFKEAAFYLRMGGSAA